MRIWECELDFLGTNKTKSDFGFLSVANNNTATQASLGIIYDSIKWTGIEDAADGVVGTTRMAVVDGNPCVTLESPAGRSTVWVSVRVSTSAEQDIVRLAPTARISAGISFPCTEIYNGLLLNVT